MTGNSKPVKKPLAILIAAMLFPCQGLGWIAYGFKSGTSRFDVAQQLAEDRSLLTTENAEQTFAARLDGQPQYTLEYCSSPHRLYLMKYTLPDSREVFARTLAKFERRYGSPEGLDKATAYLQSDDPQDIEITLIWNLNESETILLTRDASGLRAEFQDVSVCR